MAYTVKFPNAPKGEEDQEFVFGPPFYTGGIVVPYTTWLCTLLPYITDAYDTYDLPRSPLKGVCR